MLKRWLTPLLTATLILIGTIPPTTAHAAPVNVYTTPGIHHVNSRMWSTECGAYSSTVHRCRTEILADTVVREGTRFKAIRSWVFNNLSYLSAPRATWGDNELANPGAYTINGRRWRTECDTAATGNGCRSYLWTTVYESSGSGYRAVNKWVFNNQVAFGTAYGRPVTEGACSLSVDGVKVAMSASQQSVTVVKTSRTAATVTMVKRARAGSCVVNTVFRDTTGRIGYGGAVPAANRRQDTVTTPQGTFTVTEAFGLAGDPGTALPYRVPGPGSYWVVDRFSDYYNQWREVSLGGFDKSESERLVDFPGQYDYAAVIDYNRWPAVVGKGGAIFVHAHGSGSTAGCVSITRVNMQVFLRNVAVGDAITIQ